MSEGIMMKRVLLLLPLLIVQYALSGADEEIAASPSVAIRRSTGAKTPSQQRVRLSSDVLQLMRQNSQEVQKEKIERKEEFVKRIEEFDVIFGEVVTNKQVQGAPADDDLFFSMDY